MEIPRTRRNVPSRMFFPSPPAAFVAGPPLPTRILPPTRRPICSQYLSADSLTIDFSVPTRTGNFGNVFFGRYDLADAVSLDVVVKCPTDSDLARKLLDMERHTNEKLAQKQPSAGARFPRYLGRLIVPPDAAVAPGLARFGLVWMLEGAGETLEDYLAGGRAGALARLLGVNATGSPVRRALAASVLSELLSLLASLKSSGIVHRDIKPANVLVVPGDAAPLKAVDFGSSCDWGSLTKRGMRVATCDPVYCAPERRLELLRPALAFDVYSVGLIALRCALPSLSDERAMAAFVEGALARCKSCLLRVCAGVEEGFVEVGQPLRADLLALGSPANEDLLALLTTMLAQAPENRTDVETASNSRFLTAERETWGIG